MHVRQSGYRVWIDIVCLQEQSTKSISSHKLYGRLYRCLIYLINEYYLSYVDIWHNPMKSHLIIIFLLLFSIGQAQTAGQLLEKAYKKKSVEKLKQFFQNWNKEIRTISEKELSILNDTIRQTYNVFTAFYKPLRIDSLGGNEQGDSIYKDVEFLVLQNSIKIYFADKVYWNEQEVDDYIINYIKRVFKGDSARKKILKRVDGKLSQRLIDNYNPNWKKEPGQTDSLVDSIDNFRPIINCNSKLPLYLSTKYEDILNAFLGNEHLPLGTGGIMNPARSSGESEQRKNFLEKCIKIWYGHWGGYWQLYSYPEAYSITFDKEMKYAKVQFRVVYSGGDAILENVNGKWILISVKNTWIE